MVPKKVLIFPAGTEIAIEIHNALKYSKFVELYGINSIPSHAEFIFEHYIQADLPFVKSPLFLDEFNKILDKYEIDYVYPAHDDACMYLTMNSDKYHAQIVTSPFKTVDICRSKNKTYQFFSKETFIPKHYSKTDNISDFPVFIKPSIGQGSVGAKIINNKTEFLQEISGDIEYAICEYLPGEEFTVDCFTDRHGTLRACNLRKRERIKMGIAVRSRILPIDEKIKNIAEIINSKLVFNGAWFFQVKKNDNGEYRLLEISPRIPGTMATSRMLGINYPLLTLYNMWGFDVEIINNEIDIILDRAFINRYKTNVDYKCVYLDFDDTVYVRDKVNINLIAFCYQCVNKKIPIYLITKHAKDIYDSLAKYKINPDLFEKIIHIEKEDDKADYIKEKKSILIDDSFSERLNVHKKLGICVYDLDMIDSLLDWRM